MENRKITYRFETETLEKMDEFEMDFLAGDCDMPGELKIYIVNREEDVFKQMPENEDIKYKEKF